MQRLFGIVCLLIMVGCGGGAPAGGTTPARVDAQELEGFVRGLLDDFTRGDFAALKASACPQAVVFDTDENGRPVDVRGREDVNAYLDHIQELIDGGMQLSTTITDLQCRPMVSGGVCMVKMDQTITADGEEQGPFHFRGTFVVEKVGDRWIWAHWHGSLAEMPDGGAPAEGDEAGPDEEEVAPSE